MFSSLKMFSEEGSISLYSVRHSNSTFVFRLLNANCSPTFVGLDNQIVLSLEREF